MNNSVVEDRAIYVQQTGKQPFYGFSRQCVATIFDTVRKRQLPAAVFARFRPVAQGKRNAMVNQTFPVVTGSECFLRNGVDEFGANSRRWKNGTVLSEACDSILPAGRHDLYFDRQHGIKNYKFFGTKLLRAQDQAQSYSQHQ